MEILALIEDEHVIKKILKHVGLWDVKPRLPPKANAPPKALEIRIDYSNSQLPLSDNYLYVDLKYLSEAQALPYGLEAEP